MKMYYDIHTHQPPTHPEDVAIVNTIIGLMNDKHKAEDSLQSCGIHPCHVQDMQQQLAQLYAHANQTDVVAIGEAGFDKRTATPRAIQQELFLTQAHLAEKVQKPLIIHCVKAWDELLAAKKIIRPSVSWIIHGFRGHKQLAAQLIRHGLKLSFGTQYNKEALRLAWPNLLFLETDDQPVDIRNVYQQASTSLNQSIESVCSQIQNNIHKAFSLPQKS